MKRALLVMAFAATGCNAILGIEDLGGPGGDDGGGTDATPDAPVSPPGVSALRAPRMGATTGSALADSSLHPRFQWRPTGGAATYELAVDDSCSTSSFRTCAFPSPEVNETGITDTAFAPSAALAVSLAAPVGRRYFWRVRACNDFGCGDWSDVWYLDVGRLPDDVNGDGYGDLIAGVESGTGESLTVGAAYLLFGRPSGVVAISKLVDPRNETDGRFGATVAMIGDVNADGYADALVGAWRTDNNDHMGTAWLYLGRGTWPASVPEASTTLALATADASTAFGGSVAGRGDMNGDGYGDMAIGAVHVLFGGGGGTPTVPGYAYVNFGRPAWSFSQIGSDLVIPDPMGEAMGVFGTGLGFGDLDEDGRSDLLVGAPGASSFLGVTRAYYGDATYPAAPHTVGTADVTFSSPATAQAFFGASVAVCGTNPDGPAVAIGAPIESHPAANAGVAYLYGARSPWPATVAAPNGTLPEPSGALNGEMGISLRCGDVDADGKDDLVVGAPTGDDTGTVYVYGDANSVTTNTPMVILTSGDPSAGILGSAVAVTDFNGDGVMDVFGGAPNLGTQSQAGRVLGWFGRSVWPASLMSADLVVNSPDVVAGARFGRALD